MYVLALMVLAVVTTTTTLPTLGDGVTTDLPVVAVPDNTTMIDAVPSPPPVTP